MSFLHEKARMDSSSCSSSSVSLIPPPGAPTSHRVPSPPADRQNALCRAMGALFLQHRVQCLEEDVAKLDRKHCLVGRHKGRGEKGGGGPHVGREPGKKSGCPFQRRAEKSSAAASESNADEQAQLLVVVDASVLIYSLRSVHEWLKEGKTRVVIPDEACRTLDVLKTKEDRLGLAARKAARFIEERMVQVRQSEATQSSASQSTLPLLRRPSWYRCPSSSSSTSRPPTTPTLDTSFTPGLIIQPGGARLSPAEAETMRAKRSLGEELQGATVGEKYPLTETDTAQSESVQPRTPSALPSLQDCPIFIRETLLCALYYLHLVGPSTASPTPPSMALAIAYPPPQHRASDQAEEDVRYLERVNPDALVARCTAYGIFDVEQTSHDHDIYDADALASGPRGVAGRLVVLPTAASWLMEDGSEESRREMHARCGGVGGGHGRGWGGRHGEGGRCHRGGGGGGEWRGGFHRGRGRGGPHHGGGGGGGGGGVGVGGGRGGGGRFHRGGRGGCHRGEGRNGEDEHPHAGGPGKGRFHWRGHEE